MTVGEAIQAANSGDTEAMYQLGRYYAEREEYEDAQAWYLMGAEAGDVRCMRFVASTGTFLACVARVLNKVSPATCVQKLETSLFWAEQAKAHGADDDFCETIRSIKGELGSSYYLAFASEQNKTEYLYRAEEMLRANYPTQDVEHKMFFALTLHDKGCLENGINDEDAVLLFNLLKDCTTNHLEKLDFGSILCYFLGEAYLKGRGCQRDDTLAHQWFSTAQAMGFNCREMLSRFKKKLFGGYVFQG